MERRGFPFQLIKFLQSLYNKTIVVLDLNDGFAENIPANKRVRQ